MGGKPSVESLYEELTVTVSADAKHHTANNLVFARLFQLMPRTTNVGCVHIDIDRSRDQWPSWPDHDCMTRARAFLIHQCVAEMDRRSTIAEISRSPPDTLLVSSVLPQWSRDCIETREVIRPILDECTLLLAPIVEICMQYVYNVPIISRSDCPNVPNGLMFDTGDDVQSQTHARVSIANIPEHGWYLRICDLGVGFHIRPDIWLLEKETKSVGGWTPRLHWYDHDRKGVGDHSGRTFFAINETTMTPAQLHHTLFQKRRRANRLPHTLYFDALSEWHDTDPPNAARYAAGKHIYTPRFRLTVIVPPLAGSPLLHITGASELKRDQLSRALCNRVSNMLETCRQFGYHVYVSPMCTYDDAHGMCETFSSSHRPLRLFSTLLYTRQVVWERLAKVRARLLVAAKIQTLDEMVERGDELLFPIGATQKDECQLVYSFDNVHLSFHTLVAQSMPKLGDQDWMVDWCIDRTRAYHLHPSSIVTGDSGTDPFLPGLLRFAEKEISSITVCHLYDEHSETTVEYANLVICQPSQWSTCVAKHPNYRHFSPFSSLAR